MDWSVVIDPFKSLLTTVGNWIPRIIAVLVLLFLAWILARVLSSGARKLMVMSKIDQRLGKGGDIKDRSRFPVANGTGTAVFAIVWMLFILAILEILGVQGIISSLTSLFGKIFAAIPNIIAALVVLAIFYFVGRLFARLVTSFLTRIHFNEVPVRLGLSQQPSEGAFSPSSVVGYVVLVFIMLAGVIMAADLLNFTTVNTLISSFTTFLAQIVFGLIIIAVGIFVANLVARVLKASGRPPIMTTIARAFIIVFSIAIALRAMGFANEIIYLSFGIMLGAVALAGVIAFGMGGRQFAADTLASLSRSNGHNTKEEIRKGPVIGSEK